ncbi:hypothetical protein ACMAY6_05440 [Luminiphilus sp. nBUS_16]|uniref:hypothetical protein n=1 Tax=Luminiphilus sp. nBUS_16 TaxID=3395315 RepID=UPI003EB6B1A4
MKYYLAGLLLLAGCSTPEKTSVTAEAVPFFPVCVAEESGGFRERHYTRQYIGLQESSDRGIIDADCIAVEP